MVGECPKCGFKRDCEGDIESSMIKLILENNKLTKEIKKLKKESEKTNE